jgi:hypothetical protein
MTSPADLLAKDAINDTLLRESDLWPHGATVIALESSVARSSVQRGLVARASAATLPRGFPGQPLRGGPLLPHCYVEMA